jgi:ABC-type nitrate/sulfonate/bicarbonate transport system permease component
MSTLDSPAHPERFAPWFSVILVYALILALFLDFVKTAQILFNPSFLRGFGFFMVQVTFISAVGGGLGTILAELALRSRWITEGAIRFLRLGMWLPFFGAWAAPTWRIEWSKELAAPDWTELILRMAIPIIPTALFAASYHQLTARFTLALDRRSAALYMFRSVVLHVLFFAFLAQLYFYYDGWQWFLYSRTEWWERAAATVLLLAGFLLLIAWGSNSGFEKTSRMKAVAAFRQIRASDWKSFLTAGSLWLLCFAVWNAFYVFLRDVFMIAPIHQVIRSAHRLLTTGSMMANMESTLWRDIAASAREIGEGLLLGGLIALMLVRVVKAGGSRIRLTWIFALTHILPIVIAVRLVPLIGIGHWLKPVIIAAASLYPFAHTLWELRTAPRLIRGLMALDNALPYAVFGMFFGELWAAVEGVGFFIIVARGKGNRTEALAASLITLGLMIVVSFILRLIMKRLLTADAEVMVVGKGNQHGPIL